MLDWHYLHHITNCAHQENKEPLTAHGLGSNCLGWFWGVGGAHLVVGNDAVLVLFTFSHCVIHKFCSLDRATVDLLPPARVDATALHIIASDGWPTSGARSTPLDLDEVLVGVLACGTSRLARNIWGVLEKVGVWGHVYDLSSVPVAGVSWLIQKSGNQESMCNIIKILISNPFIPFPTKFIHPSKHSRVSVYKFNSFWNFAFIPKCS